MSLASNKKGMEFLVELAISVLLMTIIFVSLLFIRGQTFITAKVTADAETAEFACNTDLMNFLKFKDNKGASFTEYLQEAFDSDKTSLFTKPAKNLLDGLLGQENWDIKVSYYNVAESHKLSDFITTTSGGTAFEDVKECTTFVPIECSPESSTGANPLDCVLLVTMEKGYGKRKVLEAESNV